MKTLLIFPCQWYPTQPYLSTPYLTSYLRQKGWDVRQRDFNIESYHVLTDLQRKFLLNIIEMDNIGLDKVYVDDYSQEQLVKKQLEL